MSKLRAGQAHAADGDARTRKRLSISSPIRRIAAAVAALALGAGLAVVGVAAPASAHHNTITGKAVCEVDGSASIEWTVTNSESDKDETIIESSDTAVVAVGTEIKKGKSATFTQTDVEPGTHTLTLKGEWTKKGSRPVTNQNSGAVTVGEAQCDDAPTVQKVTFCHATGSESNPYVRITTSVNAFFRSGHDKHQGLEDIYPAFSYVKHGKTYHVKENGDQSLLQYADCTKPKPVEIEVEGAPSFSDTCGPDNEKLTVPADTKYIDWEKTEQNGVITVTATAKDGYVFKAGAKTVWTFTIDDAPCPPTEVPVGGEPTFSDTCGVDNEKLTVPVDTDFVDWNHSESNGVITVTATPKKDYVFPKDAQTVWTFTIDDSDCIVDVVGAPTFSDTCGVDNEKLTVPDDTEYIDWEKNEVGGVITVTATPQKGYAFPKDAQTEWKYTIDDEPCIVEIEDAPTFEDTCGPANEKLGLPDDTDSIDWESVREGDIITVTATAKGGSVFPEGAQVKWTFTVDDKPCVIELEGEPTFSDVCGPDNEKISYPADTELVTWSRSEVDGKLVVTAKAAEGNTFAQGPVVVWTYVLDDEPCLAPVLDGSVATGVCEADAPWISYKVTLTDPDNQATSRTVSLVLSDGEHTETIELGELDEDGVLEGRTLWPGASVDDEGNATGWPGWKQLADGTWVQTDDNFAWTRDLTSATFIVNPELAVDLAYPPATPDCIAAPPTPETPGEPGGDGDTPSTPAAGGDGLADTGFAGTTIAIVAGVVVLAGIAFLVIARLRRKQS